MRLLLTSIITILLLATPLLLSGRFIALLPLPVAQRIQSIVGTVIPPAPTPVSSDTLQSFINALRVENGSESLPIGQKTCLMANSALVNQDLDPDIVAQKCPECISVQIARFNQPVNLDWLEQQIETNASMSAYLLSSELTHICVATSSSQAVVTLVSARTTPNPPPANVPKNFTEDQLWQALTTYRQSQGRSNLERDENLCIYARKRVQDHLDLFEQKIDPQNYPVEAKYPLDAHQGFQQDADSGIVFEVTNRNQVAENLAYWPNAIDPIHVIEWGWDTSTEGHREAQLSNDWTHACLSGEEGFFVAIFAK